MKDFTMDVRKVMDSIEVMARRIETDENLKEYFVEAYGYLDVMMQFPPYWRTFRKISASNH